MPKILGTLKKSQTINHNLPQKIVMIKVIIFYMTTWWRWQDKTEYVLYIYIYTHTHTHVHVSSANRVA